MSAARRIVLNQIKEKRPMNEEALAAHDQAKAAYLNVVGQRETIEAEEAVTLDPNDPFDEVLIELVTTNRRKRSDYAFDSDVFSNFRETSRAMGIEGFTEVESAFFNICQKIARIKSLRVNGRTQNPSNEAIEDSYLDLACYAVIALALVRERRGEQA